MEGEEQLSRGGDLDAEVILDELALPEKVPAVVTGQIRRLGLYRSCDDRGVLRLDKSRHSSHQSSGWVHNGRGENVTEAMVGRKGSRRLQNEIALGLPQHILRDNQPNLAAEAEIYQ